ncbi:hypothetical protein BCV71DRAFT_227329 [Rhizopus microsporus]|uniref:Uncharacterized protein n=1 Tax=Rhizopus microsporus TaxID=58291 RepID=A0A1X0S0W7_RHIZD|nr:hypothetical protein BCV71DRAFT_227329 [Rhizopus microsporus]
MSFEDCSSEKKALYSSTTIPKYFESSDCCCDDILQALIKPIRQLNTKQPAETRSSRRTVGVCIS